MSIAASSALNNPSLFLFFAAANVQSFARSVAFICISKFNSAGDIFYRDSSAAVIGELGIKRTRSRQDGEDGRKAIDVNSFITSPKCRRAEPLCGACIAHRATRATANDTAKEEWEWGF